MGDIPFTRSLTTAQKLSIEVAGTADVEYRDSIGNLPARPTADLNDVVRRFREPLFEEG